MKTKKSVSLTTPPLDPRLEEIAGHLNAKDRRILAEVYKRYANQLCESADAMDALKLTKNHIELARFWVARLNKVDAANFVAMCFELSRQSTFEDAVEGKAPKIETDPERAMMRCGQKVFERLQWIESARS